MARSTGTTWPFLAGIAAGMAAAAAWDAAPRVRRSARLDPRLIRALPRHDKPVPVVFVPGIMGSQLLRPDGTEAWLNLGNTLGHHDLTLPRRLPLAASRDELAPGFLIGTDTALPRAFGFTEYDDFLDLLDSAGYEPGVGPGLRYAVYTYDWRRDLVESARGLALRLEGLAQASGDPAARFHLVGHSMGGLVVRWYLRYGGADADPNAPVTWAGARRIASVLLTATPSGGSIAALRAILGGERVGLSNTTLAASVVSRMPSVYQLLPPPGTSPIVDPSGRPVEHGLLEPATWKRFGWGPYGPKSADASTEAKAFLEAALARARAFHAGLARPPDRPAPVPVHALGGDCLPTLARAVVGEGRAGTLPRFEATNSAEQDVLFDAGDGRVTRASSLATHLARTDGDPDASGIPELSAAVFGSSDHHGLFADPAFQSLLLRLLLRAAPLALARPA
jgi:Lecithin:cholesterol acyltransferase